ncbi:hypothetical protein [Lentilactobacillus parafarraginis]|uniref:hypothetical protein n=1 Tax=Lentilactobacillus parafarraginis TaxID=390842 RepID=UPI000AC46F41|nr:hypothetical protein [Lentilactobacillus parafarraginis]
MDRKQLDTLIAQRDENRHPLAQIRRESETEFTINNHKYEVVHSFNDGFNFEEFIRRYNPALSSMIISLAIGVTASCALKDSIVKLVTR